MSDRRSWYGLDAEASQVAKPQVKPTSPPQHCRVDARPGPKPEAQAQTATETVVFLLIPNFSIMSFTSAVEPLRLANRVSGKQLYRWRTVSTDGGPVRASNGITVLADEGMNVVAVQPGQRPPTVCVVSGLGVERFRDKAVTAWLRKMDRFGAEIGALCTGALVLARAGLLEGYRCTIHWENLPGFVEEFPEADVASDLYEVHGKRFTCSGGTAPLDLMLTRIREVHGDGLATKISEMCLLDRVRGPHDRQRMPVRVRLGVHHPKLVLAIELMEANLEDPLGQEQVAGYVGLSRRQLERLFRKHLGRTPAQYYLELRLERARHLLYQTDLPVMSVACACGFVSASHFSTCYRQMYGRTPRAERLQAA